LIILYLLSARAKIYSSEIISSVCKSMVYTSDSLPDFGSVLQDQQANIRHGSMTCLLQNRHVFLDMLTDSGTNAMSDNQVAAMMVADDAYAGSFSYSKLEKAV
jgi:hypothetical protein